MKTKRTEYLIIGSGFGGALAAYNLARAGKEVLIVERGKWVVRDDTCWDEVALHLKDPLYRGETPYLVNQKRGRVQEDWPDDTVGGMSPFYGAVSLRMREEDFQGAPVPGSDHRDSESAWPFGYSELSSHYDLAEKLQGVAGIRGEDITEPERLEYPQRPPEILSQPSRLIWDAAVSLGMHPFHLPMAINFSGEWGKEKCILCATCDHYLCKIEAKNDLSVVVLPDAMDMGTVLMDNHRAVRINTGGSRARSVTVIDQEKGDETTITADHVIISAGALSTPALLLASGIQHHSKGGALIGRYLMRHANGVVAGVFPFRTNPEMVLQKQVGIPDFYYGLPEPEAEPRGVWGLIQDVSSIGKGVIKDNAPFGLKNVAAFFSDYLINQLCIAEDIPQLENRVSLHPSKRDRFGFPLPLVYHRYHHRDIAARNALYRMAKKVLRKAGALMFYTMPIETFSHAIGTCRFGTKRATSVLDPDCRVWGFENLYVCDASFMPSGGSVNPSLTIAANALRISEHLAQG
jgi:choline dehydrogenase-like flavoprotein